MRRCREQGELIRWPGMPRWLRLAAAREMFTLEKHENRSCPRQNGVWETRQSPNLDPIRTVGSARL